MPRPSNFGKDTGLQVRMTMTLFLLGLVYAVLIGVIVAARALPLLIIVGGLLAVQFFASDKLALHAMGAREVTPQEAPQLHAMVERLCVQANLPKPRVAVANTPMPNAFAIGRSPKKRDRLRDDRDHGPALPRGARGRDGARADARAEPRRDGDDDRQLLRRDRLLHRPVRLPLRRRRRR